MSMRTVSNGDHKTREPREGYRGPGQEVAATRKGCWMK